MTPKCPECAGILDLDEGVMQGELIPCADCGAELEIITLCPLIIELAPELEEDWGE